MAKKYPSHEEIQHVYQQLSEMRLEKWLYHDLFSFQWFLLLIVLVIPWIIWWRFVDKKRIVQISLFGALMTILVLLMDDIGMELQLWSYRYQLIHVIPKLIAVDIGVIIVVHMFLYQYFITWKKFVMANIIVAIIYTLIFEPITVWIGIYELENWRYIYSLPIYILKAIFIKWLVDEIIPSKKNHA